MEVVTNLVGMCLAMPMPTFIYKCMSVDAHVGRFVCMSMSVSLSVPMPACPHLHFVRPGWRGAPVGKNSVHKSDRLFKAVDVDASPRPCHADAHVQTYVCIPVCLFPHARVRIYGVRASGWPYQGPSFVDHVFLD